MIFKDDLLDDIDEIFFEEDGFAEKVLYTPDSGTPKEIFIIKSFDEDLKTMSSGQAAYITVRVKAADITPHFKDTFQLDGLVWLVEKTESINDGLVYVLIARSKTRGKN